MCKGTKAEFCFAARVVMYAGKLGHILPSENSLELSHAYTTDFCQQSCTGQKAWRGAIPEGRGHAGTAPRHSMCVLGKPPLLQPARDSCWALVDQGFATIAPSAM